MIVGQRYKNEKNQSNEPRFKTMAKERLSKLQKWILKKCLKDLKIYYRNVFMFFGKKYSQRQAPEILGKGWNLKERYGDNYKNELNIEEVKEEYSFNPRHFWEGYKITPKKEFCISNSEKVIISRSFKNLVGKGLLAQPEKWRGYYLTEKGFLKANKFVGYERIVSFKEYQKRIKEARERERQEAEIRHKKIAEEWAETLKKLRTKS